MRGFFLFCFIFLRVISVFPQNSQEPSSSPSSPEREARKDDVWICMSADTAFYRSSGMCFGGALAVAYGSGVSVGFKAAYFADYVSKTDVLEICFLLRFYIKGLEANSGPYVQASLGQALFFRREEGLSIPAQWGMISAGANAGWRFLFGKVFYLEPFISGGYPYLFGAGLGAGVRF